MCAQGNKKYVYAIGIRNWSEKDYYLQNIKFVLEASPSCIRK